MDSAKALRILSIEDSAFDAEMICRHIKGSGYEPLWHRVDTVQAMAQALEKDHWDVILSDHSMADFSVDQAIQVLQDKRLDIPLIIVSGAVDPDAVAAAMKAGAKDCILKGDLARLVPAIERELREASLRREKQKAEENLLQAQKMESIGRLAGGIAHDFNNILTAVLAYASLLSKDSPTLEEDAKEIEKAAQRGAALARQLLAFSRRQVIQPTVVDLNAEVAEMEKLLQRTIGEKTELVTFLSPVLGLVKIDVGQFHQVLMNLAVNAKDAMPGGGKITLRTENAEVHPGRAAQGLGLAPGAYALISVSDTGVGMDQETRAHLFEPFFTTKEPGKGTGLGLSTVYGIVKQSGGAIFVDSLPGKGATFRIYFPLVSGQPQTKEPETVLSRPSTGRESILVVDDDEATRNLLGRVLRNSGYMVLTARGGTEALDAALQRQTIDLLLTDLVLPDMDGVDLSERLRSSHLEARSLFVSGYLDGDLSRRTLDPALPFLQKPFTPNVLLRRVREVLGSESTP